MKLVNLTPHALDFYNQDVPDLATDEELAAGLIASIPASGQMARVAVEDCGVSGTVEVAPGVTVPLHDAWYGDLENLPAPQDGVAYVVPLLTAMAAKDRPDLLVPHGQVRNVKGTIVGCRALSVCR